MKQKVKKEKKRTPRVNTPNVSFTFIFNKVENKIIAIGVDSKGNQILRGAKRTTKTALENLDKKGIKPTVKL